MDDAEENEETDDVVSTPLVKAADVVGENAPTVLAPASRATALIFITMQSRSRREGTGPEST